MANGSYPESVIVPDLTESSQEDLLVTKQTPSKSYWDYVYHYLAIVHLTLYLFGFFSNISILVVFLKDGFSSSTNISFFSLALADLTVCVTYCTGYISRFLAPICRMCWKIYFARFKDWQQFEQLPTAMTTWITAILCWERLCCIAYPMKVKRIFTRRFTTGMILGYMLLQVLAVTVHFGAEAYHSMLFRDPASFKPNGWQYTACTSHKVNIIGQVKLYTNGIVSTGCNMIMYALLLLGTTLFVICLTKGVQARKSLMAKKDGNDSAKERRLIKTVIVVCIIYIITAGPISLNRALLYLVDAAKETWVYILIKYEQISFNPYYRISLNLLQNINHCFNIFVYLPMNSKFRRIFCQMFCLKYVMRQTSRN